jgi:hypothetical protein
MARPCSVITMLDNSPPPIPINEADAPMIKAIGRDETAEHAVPELWHAVRKDEPRRRGERNQDKDRLEQRRRRVACQDGTGQDAGDDGSIHFLNSAMSIAVAPRCVLKEAIEVGMISASEVPAQSGIRRSSGTLNQRKT